MKYAGERARAEWCAEELLTLPVLADPEAATVLVPVPLHPERLHERGFNQSQVICDYMHRATGLPVLDGLVRIRRTRSQVGLDAAARSANLGGAFVASMSMEGAAVVLVDDVVTTGATLLAAAQACRVAGADSVAAVTVVTGI